MLELRFQGWFQCRLATDPDPADEPRGVSGYTFAYAGEPDLDRAIRFGAPPFARIPGPPVAVTVRDVLRDGAPVAHPLRGAPVELLDEPCFEGRNGLIGEAGREPIHPLHVRIARAGTWIRRRDRLDPEDHGPAEADREFLRRRAGRGAELGPDAIAELHAATGISDFARYREQRALDLAAALRAERDPVRAAALRARSAALPPIERIRVSYRMRLGEFGEPGAFSDDLRAVVDVDAPWELSFWMGAWDGDALCGYTAGALILPGPAPISGA